MRAGVSPSAASTQADASVPSSGGATAVALVTGAALLGVAASVATYVRGRRLTFDGYHYVEMAKQFAQEWPDRFGNHWTFGYPFAGGLLTRLGLPAYGSLVLLSTAALCGLLWAFRGILAERGVPRRGQAAALAALAVCPVVAIELFGVLTELPFAAAVLALALVLARASTAPRLLWLAATAALAAFSIRYAGVLALATLGLWSLLMLRNAGRSGRIHVIAATACAAVISLLLLGLNLWRSGHLSGADRSGAEGLSSFPQQLADFGWAPVSALIGNGLRERLVVASPLATHALGSLVTAALLLLAWSAWRRSSARYSQTLALTVVVYTLGMAALRCVGTFDGLSNGRMFLPILAPALLLVFEHWRRPAAVFGVCAALGLLGGLGALRGISAQIGANVQPGVDRLRQELRADDRIGINDHAFALTAHFDQRTVRTWPIENFSVPMCRLYVIAARPLDRAGTPGELASDWRDAIARAVEGGRCRILEQQPGLVVLERRGAP